MLNYRNLDEVDEFAGRNTTTEVLAHWVFGRLAGRIARRVNWALRRGTCATSKVTLRESHVAWASYRGDPRVVGLMHHTLRRGQVLDAPHPGAARAIPKRAPAATSTTAACPRRCNGEACRSTCCVSMPAFRFPSAQALRARRGCIRRRCPMVHGCWWTGSPWAPCPAWWPGNVAVDGSSPWCTTPWPWKAGSTPDGASLEHSEREALAAARHVIVTSSWTGALLEERYGVPAAAPERCGTGNGSGNARPGFGWTRSALALRGHADPPQGPRPAAGRTRTTVASPATGSCSASARRIGIREHAQRLHQQVQRHGLEGRVHLAGEMDATSLRPALPTRPTPSCCPPAWRATAWLSRKPWPAAFR